MRRFSQSNDSNGKEAVAGSSSVSPAQVAAHRALGAAQLRGNLVEPAQFRQVAVGVVGDQVREPEFDCAVLAAVPKRRGASARRAGRRPRTAAAGAPTPSAARPGESALRAGARRAARERDPSPLPPAVAARPLSGRAGARRAPQSNPAPRASAGSQPHQTPVLSGRQAVYTGQMRGRQRSVGALDIQTVLLQRDEWLVARRYLSQESLSGLLDRDDHPPKKIKEEPTSAPPEGLKSSNR